MEFIQMLITQFGPWAVVCGVLYWAAQYIQTEGDKNRAERQTESERHTEEVKTLSDVIANNTDAIKELTTFIKEVNSNGKVSD